MSDLWWLALLPPLAAPLTYLLRRRGLLAGGLAAGACLAAAGLALTLPAGATTELLGRLFSLNVAGRLVLLFIFLLVAWLSLYPWPGPGAGLFRPFALLGAGLVAVGMLAQSLPLSVLFLELGALSLLVPIQAGGVRPPRAAMGYLVLVVVVMPCLLLAGWLIEGYSPIPEAAWALRPITVLLTVGLGLILGLVPLHGWWRGLVDEAPPAAIALIGAAIPGVSLGLLASVLGRFPWMVEEGVARPALLGLGLLSAVVGAVLGLLPDPGPLRARPDRRGESLPTWPWGRLRRVLGWWAVHDLGVIAVGVGTGSLAGLTGAAMGLLSRCLALALMVMGLSGAGQEFRVASPGRRNARPSEGNTSLTWGWRALAVLVGGWALAGAPLSGGFPGRWLVYRAAFDLEPAFAYLLVLSAGLAVLSFLRGLRVVLTARRPSLGPRVPEGHEMENDRESDRRIQAVAPSVVQTIMIVAVVILLLCLGLFPQFVIEILLPQMAGLAF